MRLYHIIIMSFCNQRTNFWNFNGVALFTPTLIGVRLIFENGVIRAGGKRADKVFHNKGNVLKDQRAYDFGLCYGHFQILVYLEKSISPNF